MSATTVVSVSPHLRDRDTTARVMWTVFIALVPALAAATYLFGLRALLLSAVAVAVSVGTEVLSQLVFKREVSVSDGSAAVTGLLLAFTCPPQTPLWMVALGAFAAIFLVKQLFGGVGYNIFNPALLGRAFLLATFPVAMTSAWLPPLKDMAVFSYLGEGINAVSTATPLAVIKEQGMAAFTEMFGSGASLYSSFFLGWRPGCIGETSGFLILLGGLYLMYRKYITWHIPVSVVGTVALLSWIFGGDTYFTGDPLLAVLSGGVLLGAFYMANDYVTSPSNKISQLVYGVGIGALTVMIRLKGGYPEGICYAILLMNSMSPVLDGWFKPRRFAPPL